MPLVLAVQLWYLFHTVARDTAHRPSPGMLLRRGSVCPQAMCHMPPRCHASPGGRLPALFGTSPCVPNKGLHCPERI